MITDAEFLAWSRTNAPKVLLVELDAYDTDAAAVVTFYGSDKGYNTNLSPTVQHRPYPDWVAKVPSARRSLGGRPSRGELVVDNTAGVRDNWLTRYKFDGRTVRMLYGSPDWLYEDFRVVFYGVTRSRAARGTKELVFKLREPEEYLDVPIQTATIATGPNAGEYEPVVYGDCFNVPAVLKDGTTSTYILSDVEITSISLVKDNGKGPVAYTADLANGEITLGAAAVGNITVDLVGAKVGAAALVKAGEIVDHIITTRTDLPAEFYDAAAFTALDADVIWEHNLAVVKTSMTARQAIDKILGSIGARLSRTADGQITVVRIDEPAAVAAVEITTDDYRLHSLVPVRIEAPWKKARLGYRKNYFVQESLETTITETDRATLRREYSIVEASNAVAAQHPLAEEPELIETTLTDQADAAARLADLMAIRAVERFLFELFAYAWILGYSIGDTVKLYNGRYGLSAGGNFVVHETDGDMTSGGGRVKLWQ